MRFTVLLAVSCAGLGAEVNDFEWRGSIAKGRLIEIRGINGDIRAEPSPTGEVEVVAKMVKEEGAESAINVQFVPNDNGVTFCAIRRGESACTPIDKPGGPGARIDYIVRVPEGVNFLGRTVNGGVEADLLESNVEAYTVNGKVRISTLGSAQARTVNGSITASLLNPFWSKPPQFTTVNGGIVLSLPANADTSLRAETRNGKITTDLRALKGKVTDNSVNGRLGAGKCGSLTIKTVNGTIQLKRAS